MFKKKEEGETTEMRVKTTKKAVVSISYNAKTEYKFCCKTMEKALIDKKILCYPDGSRSDYDRWVRTIGVDKNGRLELDLDSKGLYPETINYCPFCGKKIIYTMEVGD